MLWTISHRADPDALPLADRHYNRQKPGSSQFVPPGRCLVLKHRTMEGRIGALWVTSWPKTEYVKHAWAGAWVNTLFRKECDGTASVFIRAAVAVSLWRYGPAPPLGIVSFIDPLHVKPRFIRSRPTWGHSYFKAGFKHVGYTKGGLWALQLLPSDMPSPRRPLLPLEAGARRP